MSELTVSELFGPTVQGEGPSAGRRAVFLRLGRCNLDCGAGEGATWACDTPYTWDWSGKLGTRYDQAVELTRRPVGELVEEIVDRGVELLVITGGEPLLQQSRLVELVDALPRMMAVEVETNGTIAPVEELARRVAFNVSPKLACSGVSRARALRPEALARLVCCEACFKFVVTDRAQLDEVQAIVEDVRIDPGQVWIMPGGTDAETLTARVVDLADEVVARGWNLTDRLHVRLWGNRRGV